MFVKNYCQKAVTDVVPGGRYTVVFLRALLLILSQGIVADFEELVAYFSRGFLWMILAVLIFMYCSFFICFNIYVLFFFLSEKILTFHICFFSSIFQDRQLLQLWHTLDTRQ